LIQYTPLWEFGYMARIADALAAGFSKLSPPGLTKHVSSTYPLRFIASWQHVHSGSAVPFVVFAWRAPSVVRTGVTVHTTKNTATIRTLNTRGRFVWHILWCVPRYAGASLGDVPGMTAGNAARVTSRDARW